jgi:hypothetical protein
MEVQTVSKKEETQVDVAELINPVSGEAVDLGNLGEVVKQWKEVKEMVSLLYRFKGQLENVIVNSVAPPEGSKTAHLVTDAGKLKVTFGSEIKWDQGLLEDAMAVLGDEGKGLVKVVYKPKLTPIKTFLATVHDNEKVETAKEMIRMAMVELPKKPYVAEE